MYINIPWKRATRILKIKLEQLKFSGRFTKLKKFKCSGYLLIQWHVIRIIKKKRFEVKLKRLENSWPAKFSWYRIPLLHLTLYIWRKKFFLGNIYKNIATELHCSLQLSAQTSIIRSRICFSVLVKVMPIGLMLLKTGRSFLKVHKFLRSLVFLPIQFILNGKYTA